jgi:hypothetical protein
LTASVFHPPKEVVEGCEFALAIYKSRSARGQGLVQLRAVAMRHTEQAICQDRFGFAFKDERSDRLDASIASRQQARRLANQDRPRLGRLLKTGGDICSITDYRVVHREIVGNGAEYDGPSVDADPQRQLHSFVIGVSPLDGESGQQSAACMIFMSHGRAEKCHKPITGEVRR